MALSLMFVPVPAQAFAGECRAWSPASDNATPSSPPPTRRSAGEATPVPQLSESGCGFLQRCIYFNRTEQRYMITGLQALVTAALCTVMAILGCALATAIVDMAADWLRDRGGVCSTSKPRLKVRYFPTPAVQGCVS